MSLRSERGGTILTAGNSEQECPIVCPVCDLFPEPGVLPTEGMLSVSSSFRSVPPQRASSFPSSPPLPNPSQSFPILPHPSQSFPILPYPSLSFPALPNPSKSFPILRNPSQSFQILPNHPNLRPPGWISTPRGGSPPPLGRISTPPGLDLHLPVGAGAAPPAGIPGNGGNFRNPGN